MLNVALIGLGNIGLLFDSEKNIPDTALSHVKAIYQHKKFTLKYIVDTEDTNITLVQNFFPNVIYNSDYKTITQNDDIDLLVIATPTNTHFQILNDFKHNKSINFFFIEKPLFNDSSHYESINNALADKIIINYQRRFNPEVQKLKEDIKNKKYFNLQKVIINYCKGLKNNGSHMIDLINFLFDNPEILSSQILDMTIGFSEKDFSYDIFIKIKYENEVIPIHFLALNYQSYNIIEMQLYFDNQFIKYVHAHNQIKYYDIDTHALYPTYNILSDKPKIQKLNNKPMLDSYNVLFGIIKQGTENISSFADEIKNITFLKNILKKV